MVSAEFGQFFQVVAILSFESEGLFDELVGLGPGLSARDLYITESEVGTSLEQIVFQEISMLGLLLRLFLHEQLT